MPVMKQLRIGSETYDTVGEATVTQVLASGTKIATVTIDGTATDLYAPEGGSSVDPATTAPSMDGTAAVGTSADYARADHVHPTDTSRLAGITLNTSAEPYDVPVSNSTAEIDIGDGLKVDDSYGAELSVKFGTTAKTVAAGNHTHSGYQPTLVSGTSIKTINGESILGSGNIATPTYTLPEATTSTLGGVKVDGTTITATDGVISAVGGGGGGGSTLTLYTNYNCSNLYVDSALTTSLLESVDYDYDAAMSMLKNAGKVIVEWTDTTGGAARYAVVCGAFYDTTEETFDVALIEVTSVVSLIKIGLT